MSDGSFAGAERRGVILALAAVAMVLLVVFAALAVDLGYVMVVRTELQAAADAAALAAGEAYPTADAGSVKSIAVSYATQNMPRRGNVLKQEDVEFGRWDMSTRTFTPGSPWTNAIRVTTRCATENGNATQLFFAAALGRDSLDLAESAVVLVPPKSPAFRFLIDDEMFDHDIDSIEDLADSLNKRRIGFPLFARR